MRYGSGIGRAEGLVHDGEKEGAHANEGVAGYLPQDDEHESAANEGCELYVIEAKLIGKFTTQDTAANSARAKYGHYQGCFANGAVLGFGEVEGHEGDDHGAGPIDEHYQ